MAFGQVLRGQQVRHKGSKSLEPSHDPAEWGGGLRQPIFFFSLKITRLSEYFIQIFTKIKPPQTLGHYTQMPPLYLCFFQKLKNCL